MSVVKLIFHYYIFVIKYFCMEMNRLVNIDTLLHIQSRNTVQTNKRYFRMYNGF